MTRFTYSCGTSSPARMPVFRKMKWIRARLPGPMLAGSIASFEYSNRV